MSEPERFSQRLDWSAADNPLARLLEQKRAAGAPVLDLTESNPTRAQLEVPAAEILASLADPRSLRYEPAPMGLAAAREAVARYYTERGLKVAPQRLMLTASTSEAYAFLFKLLLDPGDRILAPRPCYPLVDYLAGLEAAQVDAYPLLYDGGWSIDLGALRAAVGPRSRCVVVIHPNNPTGSFLKRAELRELIAICREKRLALICDEVFSDYALAADPERVDSLIDSEAVLSFVLSGLSKVVGLPQMKLSWIGVGGPEPERTAALRGLEHIGDTFLSVATPVQHAAAALLALRPRIQAQIGARIRANHDWLARQIGDSSLCRLLKVEGGWYTVIRVPNLRGDAEWALELLRTDNVHVHPGYLFDFPSQAYLVTSLLTAPEIFREGTARLLRRVATIAASNGPAS